MGFAAQWASAMADIQAPMSMDKMDNMDTIQAGGNSVHSVHIVHRGSTPATPPIPTVTAPGGAGLEWISNPTDPDASDYGSQWAAYDLADLARLYSICIVRAGERVLAVYPPDLESELIAYASELLAEAQPYLAANIDRLPILTPAAAVKTILEIMRQHDGLRFTRGEDGSRWPLYPTSWTAGQRVTLQALWFAAGDALDLDEFMEVDA